jgi:hypothetical protein
MYSRHEGNHKKIQYMRSAGGTNAASIDSLGGPLVMGDNPYLVMHGMCGGGGVGHRSFLWKAVSFLVKVYCYYVIVY